MTFRILAAAAASTLALGLVAATPTSASATITDETATNSVTTQAYPACDGWTDFDVGDGLVTTKPTVRMGDGNTRCQLGAGTGGRAVVLLQRVLNLCYHRGLAIDGIYGPRMRAAVEYVQWYHGLPITGVYAPPMDRVMMFGFFNSDTGAFVRC